MLAINNCSFLPLFALPGGSSSVLTGCLDGGKVSMGGSDMPDFSRLADGRVLDLRPMDKDATPLVFSSGKGWIPFDCYRWYILSVGGIVYVRVVSETWGISPRDSKSFLAAPTVLWSTLKSSAICLSDFSGVSFAMVFTL